MDSHGLSISLIFDSMKINPFAALFIILMNSTLCYSQKNNGDSIESRSFSNYNFEASTNKDNILRSKYEKSNINPPKQVNGKFKQTGFFLYLDTVNIVTNKAGILCHQLYWVNNSDSVMSFRSISVEAEIIDNKGKWRTKPENTNIHEGIYTGGWDCTDESYKIYLSPNEYWVFNVPILKGSYKTKLRYRYLYEKAFVDFKTAEIDVYVNIDTSTQTASSNTLSYLQSLPSPQQSVISLDAMNVLYLGLYNPITVSIFGEDSNEIFIKPSCGRAIKDTLKPHSFYISFNSAYNEEREVSIDVYSKTQHDSIELKGRHLYRIRPIPKPQPMLGSIYKSGPVNKGVLRAASFVFAILVDFPFAGVKFSIESYSIYWKKTNGEIVKLEGEGPKVTKDMMRAFQFAKSGDIFTVKEIIVNGPQGKQDITEELFIIVE